MIIVVVDFVGREQLPRRQYLLLFGEEHLQRRLDLRIAGSQTGRQRLDLHLDVLQVFLFLGRQLYRVYPLVLRRHVRRCRRRYDVDVAGLLQQLAEQLLHVLIRTVRIVRFGRGLGWHFWGTLLLD